ncbi:DUF397 domain-containing protein [Sphaerisporangium dianthi]|uniref:DUF397 domain-containing protein n=1 Tax=Sphaerisporangium dianthi TaxID=1436120 RepID=A0ABV9CJ42_9ACTN
MESHQLTPDLSAAEWRKARRSGSEGGNCVEVARNLPGLVAVRDSKHPTAPLSSSPPEEWRLFVLETKAGRV